MKKKVLSLMLAGVLLIGGSMTVFAAEGLETDTSGNDIWSALPTEEQSIDIDATIQEATINITITKDNRIIANPYKLSVAGDPDGEKTLEGATIIFTNGSDAAVSIGLKGQITLSSGNDSKPSDSKVTIASDKKSVETAERKQVYVQAEIVNADGVSGNDILPGALYFANAKSKVVEPLVYSKSGAALTEAPVLAKAGYAGDVENAQESMAVVISGATSASTSSVWDDTDAFTVSTIYDLKLAQEPSKFMTKTT